MNDFSPILAHNLGVTRLVHLLEAASPTETITDRREVLAQVSRHAQGVAPFITPDETRCPETGQAIQTTPAGDAVRRLIDDLRDSGVHLTIPLLLAHSEELSALRKRRKAVRPPPVIPLQARLQRRLRVRTQEAVQDRRLSVPTGWSWSEARVVARDRAQRIWLVHREYRYEYSRRVGAWWTGAAYLTGVEDGQVWVERVPRHITTIEDALTAITPAAVQRARDQDRQVLRQGDVWLVEKLRGPDSLEALPHSHQFDPAQRVLRHRQHGALAVPFRARAYVNRSLTGTWGD